LIAAFLSSSSGKPRLRGADRGTQRRRQAKSLRRKVREDLVRDTFALTRAAGSPGSAARPGGWRKERAACWMTKEGVWH